MSEILFRLNSLNEELGFDYARALLRIARTLSYSEISEIIGYENKSAINKIIAGATPSHPHGEAIWQLYIDLFSERPPTKISFSQRVYKGKAL